MPLWVQLLSLHWPYSLPQVIPNPRHRQLHNTKYWVSRKGFHPFFNENENSFREQKSNNTWSNLLLLAPTWPWHRMIEALTCHGATTYKGKENQVQGDLCAWADKEPKDWFDEQVCHSVLTRCRWRTLSKKRVVCVLGDTLRSWPPPPLPRQKQPRNWRACICGQWLGGDISRAAADDNESTEPANQNTNKNLEWIYYVYTKKILKNPPK